MGARDQDDADSTPMGGTDTSERMSDGDALLWNLEKDPSLRSTVTSIAILDRAPDRDRMRRRIELGTRRIPRLRQRVVRLPYSVAPPRWEVDPHFDLRYHLRWSRAAGKGTTAELFDIAEPIAMQGFDRARPLWELTVVEGLADDRAAVIAKFHHSITDGIGADRLQAELVDTGRHPASPPEDLALPPAPAAPAPTSELRRLGVAVADETLRQVRGAGNLAGEVAAAAGRLREDPVGVAVDLAHSAASVARMLAPTIEPMSPLMTGRSPGVRFGRIDLPLAAATDAADLVNGRLADAVVAGTAGGLDRYHRYHGHGEVGALRLAMPLDRADGPLPRPEDGVTSHFFPARFTVPLDLEDPLERLHALRLLLDRQRSEPALGFSAPLANLVNRLPVTATTAVFGSLIRGIDVLVAEAGTPPAPRYLAGAAIESQFAFAPLAGAGVSILAMASGDRLNLGVTMDPAAVADPDVLMDCLTDGYEEIVKLV